MAETRTAIVLRRFLRRAELGMIAILLAPAIIDSSRLKVAIGVRAIPGVAVRRRQADRVQPVDLFTIGDTIAVSVPIAPAVPHLASRDARPAVVAISQAALHAAENARPGASFRSGTRDRHPIKRAVTLAGA
jgi:hypothetical protein